MAYANGSLIRRLITRHHPRQAETAAIGLNQQRDDPTSPEATADSTGCPQSIDIQADTSQGCLNRAQGELTGSLPARLSGEKLGMGGHTGASTGIVRCRLATS